MRESSKSFPVSWAYVKFDECVELTGRKVWV